MLPKEQEILAAIKDAEAEQKEARSQVDRLKKELLDAETCLIAATLHRERLAEDLRVYRNTTPRHEETLRDKEIADFRAKMEGFKKSGLL